MREIKECTAEVFRRSEKRIKDRQKARNRVLVLCIPLCVAVTAASVMLLPALTPAKRTQNNTYGTTGEAYRDDGSPEMAGDALDSIDCPYTSVEIQIANVSDLSSAQSERVTDQAVITELYNAVDSLFVSSGSAGEIGQTVSAEQEAAEGNTYQDQAESAVTRQEYTITFTTEAGLHTVYHLSGNTLLNCETKETVTLSVGQMAELLAGFGIWK